MRCFQAWKASLEEAVVARRHDQTAARHYYKQHQRLHFHAWKTASQQSQFVARVQHLQTEHDRLLVETASEYQVKIQQVRWLNAVIEWSLSEAPLTESVFVVQLQQELETSRRQVAVSQQCCQRLEDDLRQVFLRGVSAMNIEALALFNSNHKKKKKPDGDAHAEMVNKQDRSEAHSYEVAHSELRDGRADAMPKEKPRATPEHLNSLNADREPAEKLARQPAGREELDSKLRAMLVSSTSRLETSLQSARDASEKNPPRASAPLNIGRRWPNSSASTNLLRSAEMVQRHMMESASAATTAAPHCSSLDFQAPSHTVRPKPMSLQSTKYQVEMAYLRNAVAGGRPATSRARTSAVAPARSPPRSRFG